MYTSNYTFAGVGATGSYGVSATASPIDVDGSLTVQSTGVYQFIFQFGELVRDPNYSYYLRTFRVMLKRNFVAGGSKLIDGGCFFLDALASAVSYKGNGVTMTWIESCDAGDTVQFVFGDALNRPYWTTPGSFACWIVSQSR